METLSLVNCTCGKDHIDMAVFPLQKLEIIDGTRYNYYTLCPNNLVIVYISWWTLRPVIHAVKSYA